MRPVATPGTISRSVRRATSPSTPPSNVQSAGPQGTPGGKAPKFNRKPGSSKQPLKVGQEVYLWILVIVEVAMVGGFRRYFRRVHGG